jgi:hypothetical protein
MMYPYVSFVQIEGNKTLLLTYQNKEQAETEYELFKLNELQWYENNENKIEIFIQRVNGSEIKIALINVIESYENHQWLTGVELTHISTASVYSPSGKTPVLPLTYQFPPTDF